jgi:hypothetical protein
MPPDGFRQCIECHLRKVFYMAVFASLDFTHTRQEGPSFCKLFKINRVIVIIDCIGGWG